MFVYRPGLLLLGSWQHAVYDIFCAVVGIVVLSAALEGYALRKLTLVERVLALAAGLALIVPSVLFDKIGLGTIAVLGALQVWRRYRAGAPGAGPASQESLRPAGALRPTPPP